MVINKSVEEGIVVLLMLALQEGHTPIGSQTLSSIMGVSDSYLKKTLRKLVVSGLVKSTPGRDGGFALARPVNAITIGDAFRALDIDGVPYKSSGIAHTVFENREPACRLAPIFIQGCEAFRKILDSHTLEELVGQIDPCDWTAIAREKQP